LADTGEEARQRLERAFAEWSDAIGMAPDPASRQRPAPTRRRPSGADHRHPGLATTGLLLAKTAHDSAPLRTALHAAISYLKYLAAAGDEP